jgi:hypothetical protein
MHLSSGQEALIDEPQTITSFGNNGQGNALGTIVLMLPKSDR